MSQTTFAPRRPSTRSRATSVLTRLTLRPVANAMPGNAPGIAASRVIVGASMRVFGSRARGTRVEPIDVRTDRGRVRAEWVTAGAAEAPTPGGEVVFYVHGSGYALCSVASHRRLVSQLSSLTGLPVLSVEYRLAPRHRFPAAADDVERAFDWLLDQGYDAGRVVAAGDSAGGHLVLDLALSRLRAGLPGPAAQVLMSPVADLTFGLAATREAVRSDPMISAAKAAQLCGHYTREADPMHARLRHVVAAGEPLAPTLIQAGGGEILAADAEHLHDMLTASGTDCRLEVWPGQMHVFQAMPRLVPEAAPALRRAARFVGESLAAAAARAQSDPGAERRTA